MPGWLQPWIDRVSGSEDEFPLEMRVFHAYLFFMPVINIPATVHNHLAGFRGMALTSAAFSVTHGLFYLLFRNRWVSTRPTLVVVFAASVVGSGVYWMVGGGIDGGGIVLWLMGAVIWVLVFEGATLGAVLAVAYFVLLVLLGMEAVRPDWVADIYPTHFERVLDVGLSAFFISGAVVAVVLTLKVNYRRAVARAEHEYERAEGLLRNMLPGAIAARLKETPGTIAERYDSVTVLFADLVGFTELSDRLEPESLVELLDTVFREVDAAADRHGLEKIKTIGDAYMVAGGVPEVRTDHADAVLAFASELLRIVGEQGRGHGLQVRIGVHTGPVVAGVIGQRKLAYDLWGDTVNVAARMESHGVPGRIQISAATREALSGAIDLEPGGTRQIKGKGEMETWFVS